MMKRGPFVGLRPFSAHDSDVFFGRSREVSVLTNLVEALPLLIVYAPSGTGKTSLLNAGLLSSISADESILPVYVSNYETDVLDELSRKLDFSANVRSETNILDMAEQHFNKTKARTLLIIDQFEERLKQSNALDGLWRELAAVGNSRTDAITVVVSLREDYLGSLEPLMRRVPSLLDSRYRVPPLSIEGLQEAVRGPLARFGISETLSDELVDQVLTDLAEADAGGSRVEPGYFQVVWAHLWNLYERGSPAFKSPAVYVTEERAEGIIRRFVDTQIGTLLSPFETMTLAASIRYMVLPTGAKVPLAVDDLAQLLQESDFTEADRLVFSDVETLGTKRVVRSLFAKLSRSEAPLLRRSVQGVRVEFQLVHDLLGEVLLKWRQRYQRADTEWPFNRLDRFAPTSRNQLTPTRMVSALHLAARIEDEVEHLQDEGPVFVDTVEQRRAKYEKIVTLMLELHSMTPSFGPFPSKLAASLRRLGDVTLPADRDVQHVLNELCSSAAYSDDPRSAHVTDSGQAALEGVVLAARRAKSLFASARSWKYLSETSARRLFGFFLLYLVPAAFGLATARWLIGHVYSLPLVAYAPITFTGITIVAAFLYANVHRDVRLRRNLAGALLTPLVRVPERKEGGRFKHQGMVARGARMAGRIVTLDWPGHFLCPLMASYLVASIVEAAGSSPTAGFHTAAVVSFGIMGIANALDRDL